MMTYFQKLLKDTRGFSIVELGVVIIIGALMTIPIYTLLFYVTDLKPTDERIEIIQEALAEHLRVTGSLPCPANPALDIETNDNAYIGQRAGIDGCSGVTLSNGVYIGAVPTHNLKVAVACAADDGNLIDGNFVSSLKNNVYSVRELITGRNNEINEATGLSVESARPNDIRCLQNEYIMNAQGQKFVYAVSQNALEEGFDLFDRDIGSIVIVNADNNVIDSNRLYTLVSLGEDGKGGYDRNGKLSAGGCAAGDLDSENCDNDNRFVAAPQNTATASYYDDTIEYGIARFMKENSFWKWDDDATQDMVLSSKAALVINSNDEKFAQTDHVIVNRGGIQVDGLLSVNAQTYGNKTTTKLGGGKLASQEQITVNESANAYNIAVAPKYCYDDAISSACGATSGSGNNGSSCSSGVNDDHQCCDTKDSFCCPVGVYNSGGSCHQYWD